MIKQTLTAFFMAGFFFLSEVDGAKAQNTGYADITALYQDLPKILKSEKWEDIEKYCYSVLIDDNTLKYMKQVNYAYRGFPDLKERFPMIIHYSRAMFLNEIVKLHSKLQQEGRLQSLEFVAIESDKTELLNKELGIEGTETSVILKAGDAEYRCKLGELLKINGQWKCFTLEPKMSLK